MTLDEKLEHFAGYAMKEARENCENTLKKYEAALEKAFEEHKEAKSRMEELEIKTETERIIRENNKRFSKEQIKIRRTLGRRQSELKNKLFAEVREELAAFRKTSAYQELLAKELKEALLFAHGEEVVLYVDPSDAERVPELEAETGAAVTVSSYSFVGGTRAVIPGRNILIDNSFETGLTEAKENFQLKGGVGNGK